MSSHTRALGVACRLDFVTARDLVTVLPLARDIWRIEMTTPERQRVSPFFLGGHDTILKNGRIPVEIVRHVLSGEPPADAFAPAWSFAGSF